MSKIEDSYIDLNSLRSEESGFIFKTKIERHKKGDKSQKLEQFPLYIIGPNY